MTSQGGNSFAMTHTRIKRHAPMLRELTRVHPRLYKAVISNCCSDLIKCIGDCAYNIDRGNVKLSKREFKKLRRYKNAFGIIRRKSVKPGRKRKALIQQRRGFFTALLGPIIGALSSIFGGTPSK